MPRLHEAASYCLLYLGFWFVSLLFFSRCFAGLADPASIDQLIIIISVYSVNITFDVYNVPDRSFCFWM